MMKPRRVMLELETENDISIEQLRKIKKITIWDEGAQANKSIAVIQSTVNVVKKER